MPEDNPAPEIKINGVEIPTEEITPTEGGPVPAELAAAVQAATEADSAKTALLRQIGALRHSEDFARRQQERLAAAQQQPLTRDEKIARWKMVGLSDPEEKFLRANPELIDDPATTRLAVSEADRHGHERGSDGHNEATVQAFRQLTQQAPAPTTAGAPAMESTPQFFQAPTPKAAPAPSHLISAPVSRGVPVGGERAESLSQVTLSREEKQIAAAAGITETEYARQKIRMEYEKRAGLRQ